MTSDHGLARHSYLLALVVGVGTSAVLLFGIGALGLIGAGGEPDRMYLGVLAIGVVGAVVARLRPVGMALTFAAMAVAQLACAAVAFAQGWQHEPGASAAEILALTAMFAGGFALSCWLFLQAD